MNELASGQAWAAFGGSNTYVTLRVSEDGWWDVLVVREREPSTVMRVAHSIFGHLLTRVA